MITIIKGYDEIESIQKLILDYYQELDRNLDFQDIDYELEHLYEKYQEPKGMLLVAKLNNKVVGCVAYHQLSDTVCEMKRLYVLPQYRHLHIGKMLVERIIQEAIDAKYNEMVLDTIEPLQSAIYLYRSFGFQETDAYYDNPMNDVIYMRLKLK